MYLAAIVGAVALTLLLLHRLLYERRRRLRPPVWKNIEAIRAARGRGWAGVSPELDALHGEAFEDRMARRRSFWARVFEAVRAESGP